MQLAEKLDWRELIEKQYRQYTYNVILRRILATIVAVEKKHEVLHNLSVCL
jgi:hypothetical protein